MFVFVGVLYNTKQVKCSFVLRGVGDKLLLNHAKCSLYDARLRKWPGTVQTIIKINSDEKVLAFLSGRNGDA